MAIKVHGNKMSTATMRVVACLFEKGLDFQYVDIDMGAGQHKQEPFLSLNVRSIYILLGLKLSSPFVYDISFFNCT